MRVTAVVTALFHLLATFIVALPVEEVDLTFPPENLTTLFNSVGDTMQCAPSNDCGFVTFNNSQHVAFGEGNCMPIIGSIQSIYVAHCYCSIWSTCNDTDTDVFIDAMILCPQPRTGDSFTMQPNFISCAGLESP